MVKVTTLQEMLALDENDVKSFSDDQLKDLLGCLHFASRIVTREINSRSEAEENPFK